MYYHVITRLKIIDYKINVFCYNLNPLEVTLRKHFFRYLYINIYMYKYLHVKSILLSCFAILNWYNKTILRARFCGLICVSFLKKNLKRIICLNISYFCHILQYYINSYYYIVHNFGLCITITILWCNIFFIIY